MIHEHKPKISIVVPVYNVKRYLAQCIESMINQTLNDIEIILVDDGSTDGSGEMCDEYAQRDNRLIVIHKENEGLSMARNDGIKASSAPYILFVDSDDWIEPVCCEISYNEATKNEADLALFNYTNIYPTGKRIIKKPEVHVGLLSPEEAMEINTRGFHSAWLALYHRDLFRDVVFPAGKFYEDVGTTHKLVHEAQRIRYIDAELYNHRLNREGSITTDPNTREHPDVEDMRLCRIEDLQKWGYNAFAQREAFSMMVNYGRTCSKYRQVAEIVDHIQGKAPGSFSKNQRIMLSVYRFSPALFHVVCKAMGKRRK